RRIAGGRGLNANANGRPALRVADEGLVGRAPLERLDPDIAVVYDRHAPPPVRLGPSPPSPMISAAPCPERPLSSRASGHGQRPWPGVMARGHGQGSWPGVMAGGLVGR